MKNKKFKFLNACLGIGSVVLSSCFIASNALKQVTESNSQKIVTENSNVILDLDKTDELSKQYAASSNPIPVSYLNISSDNTLLGFVGNPTEPPAWLKDYDTLLIPANVTSIGKDAFVHYQPTPYAHIGLIGGTDVNITIKFEKNAKCGELDWDVFWNCTGITRFDARNASQLIFDDNYSAFCGCTNLSYVDLSECTKITKIYSNAFANCTGLKEIYLPSSLNELRFTPFDSCNVDKIHFGWTKDQLNDSSFNISGASLLPAVSSDATIYLQDGVTLDDIKNKISDLPASYNVTTLVVESDPIRPKSVVISWSDKSTKITGKVNTSGEASGELSASFLPSDAITKDITWSVDTDQTNAISLSDTNKISWSSIPAAGSYEFSIKATCDVDGEDITDVKDFTLVINDTNSAAGSIALGLSIGIGVPFVAFLVTSGVFFIKSRKEKESIV